MNWQRAGMFRAYPELISMALFIPAQEYLQPYTGFSAAPYSAIRLTLRQRAEFAINAVGASLSFPSIKICEFK
jgi:hypothetical protein